MRNNKYNQLTILTDCIIKKTGLVIVLVFFIFYITLPCFAETMKPAALLINNIEKKEITIYSSYNPDFLHSCVYCTAVNSDYSQSLSAPLQDRSEKENPLRRFEITFFIAAPFVFISTFITLHTYGVISKRNTNINVWKSYKPALFIGTFGVSTAIATREAWITWKDNKKNEDSANRIISLFATKDF